MIAFDLLCKRCRKAQKARTESWCPTCHQEMVWIVNHPQGVECQKSSPPIVPAGTFPTDHALRWFDSDSAAVTYSANGYSSFYSDGESPGWHNVVRRMEEDSTDGGLQ